MDTQAIHEFIDNFLATEKKQTDVAALLKELEDRTHEDGTVDVSIGDNRTLFTLPTSVLIDYFSSVALEVEADLSDVATTFKAMPVKQDAR